MKMEIKMVFCCFSCRAHGIGCSNASSVSAAGNGELTRYNFFWKYDTEANNTFYFGSNYA